MGHYSNFLFADPSFLEGVGRLFDFGGTLQQYNTSRSPEEADVLAAYADWSAVGSEIRRAARKAAKKLRKKDRSSHRK